MKVYLVINENANSALLSFKEIFKIFNTPEKALEHAQSIGYKNNFGLCDLTTVGVKNVFASGDVKVSILVMEIE